MASKAVRNSQAGTPANTAVAQQVTGDLSTASIAGPSKAIIVSVWGGE